MAVKRVQRPPVFVVKNGLSALLMISVWQKRFPGQEFAYYFDDDPRHKRDVEIVLDGVASKRRLYSGKEAPADTVLCLTQSLGRDAVSFVRETGCRRRVQVEHGTAEITRYVRWCLGDTPPKRRARIYYFLFKKRLEKYFEARGIVAKAPMRQVPVKPLRDFLSEKTKGQPVRGAHTDSSLFLTQPLIERNLLTAETLERVVKSFLDRAPARHYVIKDHPESSPKTTGVFTGELARRGMTFELLDRDNDLIELSFPKFGCREVSTFFSTGAMVCSTLFRAHYDTMLPELAEEIGETKESYRPMLAFLRDLFAPDPDGTLKT